MEHVVAAGVVISVFWLGRATVTRQRQRVAVGGALEMIERVRELIRGNERNVSRRALRDELNELEAKLRKSLDD